MHETSAIRFLNDNNNKTNKGARGRCSRTQHAHIHSTFTSRTRPFENGTRVYVTLTQLTHTCKRPGKIHPHQSNGQLQQSSHPIGRLQCCKGVQLALQVYINWRLLGRCAHWRGWQVSRQSGRSTRDTLIHNVWQHRLCSFLQPTVSMVTAHLCTLFLGVSIQKYILSGRIMNYFQKLL